MKFQRSIRDEDFNRRIEVMGHTHEFFFLVGLLASMIIFSIVFYFGLPILIAHFR